MGMTSLTTALSGLRAAQEQMATISANLANASTPGYTRKNLPLYSRTIEGAGVGVATGVLFRNVNLNLSRDMWTQNSIAQSTQIRQIYLNRIESSQGKPEDESSISAKIAQLRDTFVSLSNMPDDDLLQMQVLNKSQDIANKLHQIAISNTTLRNDVQGEMSTTIQRINSLLTQLASANNAIQDSKTVGRSSADMEDQRDRTMKELSGLIGVSFFMRGDGVMLVQTLSGQELASETARQLTFEPIPIGINSAYPYSVSAVYLGDPETGRAGAVDITSITLGGKLGGLISLRDNDLPQQMAQMDELAFRLASRIKDQGLNLFTDSQGTIPADLPPDPNADPPIPVPYVGFAAMLEVNPAIVNDPSLLQRGTVATDLPVAPGSSDVLRRIVDFAFGGASHQQVTGTANIRATANGATDMQEWLGIFSTNTITGTRAIGGLGNLMTAAGSPFTPAGADQFTLTLDPNGEGPGPLTYTINMNTIVPVGAATAANLATHISGLHADLNATIDSTGRLVITSRHDMALADVNMGSAGFTFLGLDVGTYAASDPYMDIRVGQNASVRVSIPPGMTETDLIDALILDPTVSGDTGVPGLAYDAVTYATTGALILRPGDNFTYPSFGGALSITSGSFTTDGTGGIGAPAGVNLTSALFGSYTAGPPPQNLSPITSIEHAPFRWDNLGTSASIQTGVRSASDIVDYSQRMVSQQASTLSSIESMQADATTFYDLLETQQINESGVNVDEELANMIIVQSAFGASARVISTITQMFDELLEII